MIKMSQSKKNPYEYLCHMTRVNFYKCGLNYMSGIYYANVHPRQYMECFYKEGCTDMPVIIWIHGGAWDDEFLTASYRPEETLAKLAEKGFFIACLEYRLTRHAVLPACLEDCRMAVRYLSCLLYTSIWFKKMMGYSITEYRKLIEIKAK